MAGPALTEDPASKLHKIWPVLALRANMSGSEALGSIDAPKTTPPASLTGPSAALPPGVGVCHSIAPVCGLSAAHDPPHHSDKPFRGFVQFVVELLASLYGT